MPQVLSFLVLLLVACLATPSVSGASHCDPDDMAFGPHYVPSGVSFGPHYVPGGVSFGPHYVPGGVSFGPRTASPAARSGAELLQGN